MSTINQILLGSLVHVSLVILWPIGHHIVRRYKAYYLYQSFIIELFIKTKVDDADIKQL